MKSAGDGWFVLWYMHILTVFFSPSPYGYTCIVDIQIYYVYTGTYMYIVYTVHVHVYTCTCTYISSVKDSATCRCTLHFVLSTMLGNKGHVVQTNTVPSNRRINSQCTNIHVHVHIFSTQVLAHFSHWQLLNAHTYTEECWWSAS